MNFQKKNNKTKAIIWHRYACLASVVFIFFFNFGVIEKPASVAFIYLMTLYVAYRVVNYTIEVWDDAKEYFIMGVRENDLDPTFQDDWTDLRFRLYFLLIILVYLSLYYAPLVYVSYSLISSYD